MHILMLFVHFMELLLSSSNLPKIYRKAKIQTLQNELLNSKQTKKQLNLVGRASTVCNTRNEDFSVRSRTWNLCYL